MGDPSVRVARGRFRGFFGSLSSVLFIWVFGVIVVGFGVYAFLSYRTASRQWNESVQEGAARFSDLIKHSTHYGMLLNRKEDVHHIIQTIAKEPGVEGVRVYDKDGVIIFSAASEEIGRSVDLQAEACVICHHGGTPLQSVPADSRARVYRGPNGDRVLGLISPIENARECHTAPCHAHPAEQTVLGVLDVKMSMAAADARLATARQQTTVAAVATALLAACLSTVFILRLVRRPVRQLISGTERVAGGDLGAEISVDSSNEIGQLADAFNRMTRDLKRARDDLTTWSNGLETKLLEKTEELSQTQRQVAHMEKMASLGKLAATVAHELNNPLAGILNYAKLVRRSLDEDEPGERDAGELARYLNLIQKEAGRCGGIVRNLLLFARSSGGEFALHPLQPIVERALMLVRHHLEMAEIRLETRLAGEDESLVCDADQLGQALLALLVNAVEAMPEGGSLELTTKRSGGDVQITISDTGVGIPPEALPHIFEPFFSSKEDKDGAGLGLAVVYGIVQRHQGRIDVESEPEKGTTFTIVLPRRPMAAGPSTPDRPRRDEEDRDEPSTAEASARRGGQQRG